MQSLNNNSTLVNTYMTWIQAVEKMELGYSVRRPSWNSWIKWAMRDSVVYQFGGIEYSSVAANTKGAENHADWVLC